MNKVEDATDISALLNDEPDDSMQDAEQIDYSDVEQIKENNSDKPAKKKKKSVLLTVLLILFALIFVFSAYKLISIKIAMKKAASDFEDISKDFHHEETYTEENNADKPHVVTSAERCSKLKKANPDFSMWISIDDTVLDYPVMYTPNDPEYYLHRDFYRADSFSGTPFVGAGCTPGDNNVIVYGHCMKDGSMFRTLLDYEQYHFYSEHPSFTIETEEGKTVYDIISVFRESVHFSGETNVFRYYNYVGNLDENTFNDYLRQIKEKSLYYIYEDAQYGDQLITLSTCHYADENARLVVVGVKR